MTVKILLFTLDGNRYGVDARQVVELIRSVAVTPLPGAPDGVSGIIDMRGRIVPVFDLRRRFGLASRAVAASDHFVVVGYSNRVAALHVDQVHELRDLDEIAIQREIEVSRVAPSIAGAARLEDGLTLIHDAGTFLTQAEADALANALAAEGS